MKIDIQRDIESLLNENDRSDENIKIFNDAIVKEMDNKIHIGSLITDIKLGRGSGYSLEDLEYDLKRADDNIAIFRESIKNEENLKKRRNEMIEVLKEKVEREFNGSHQ